MYQLFRPLLFQLDAERAHALGLGAAALAQRTTLAPIESWYGFEDERLKTRLWDETFPNPVGLAAGFDKNARFPQVWEALGFGFVEVGSVTAQPADGNPTPCAFRLPEDEALINRLGLNNDGAETVAERLEAGRNDRTRPLGVNLAKTPSPDVLGEAALEDFRRSFQRLEPQASYVTLNVSCPNTEDGTTFEAPPALDALLSVIDEEQKAPGLETPILVKLGPPLSDRVFFDTHLEEVVAVAEEHDVHGYVATNTAPDRSNLRTSEARLAAIGEGGVSGRPLADRATCLVRYLYRATDGETPVIGVGGVNSAAAAYKKIQAGASLVQLYTGLIYEGPGIVRKIKEGLVDRLREDGHVSITDAVGTKA